MKTRRIAKQNQEDIEELFVKFGEMRDGAGLEIDNIVENAEDVEDEVKMLSDNVSALYEKLEALANFVDAAYELPEELRGRYVKVKK